METIEQLKGWAMENGDVQTPRLVTIVGQVRTGNTFPLPPWLNPASSSKRAEIPDK